MRDASGPHHPREYEPVLGARVPSGVTIPVLCAGNFLGCLASSHERPEVRTGTMWGSAALGLGVAAVVQLRRWRRRAEPGAAPDRRGM
jgi:hypothetical protein